MAFCNSCGAALNPGTRFCNKCGAAVVASSPASAARSSAPATFATPAVASQTQATPSQGGGALKIILIVVGVIVLIGILGVASVGFFAWRIARHSHVRQEGDNVKVETPFGTVQTTSDPQEAARNLGVEIYPGAKVLKDGTTSASIAGIHNVTVSMESDDPIDKVTNFYKSKFPNAMVTASDSNQSTIVSNDRKSLITININADGNRTKILITNISGKSGASPPASN
jgi:flagellar basal body-associated protein FliL